MAVEVGFLKNGFLGFYQKNLKTSKVRILGFLGAYRKKTFKNPVFRLTVTAENCCLSV